MMIFTRMAFLKHLFFLGMAVMALVGCQTSEEPYTSDPTDVPVSVSVASRQTSDPVDNRELINSWWVVFVQTDGKVAAIAEGQPASPAEHDEVRQQLSRGKYTAYAFANITPEDLKEATGLTFKAGEKFDGDIQKIVWSDLENLPEGNIPMTGTSVITVTDRVHEPFDIEVIRMHAKIEVAFKSDATDDITVRSIDFEPMCQGAVLLMPDFDITKAPDLLDANGATIGATVSNTLNGFIVAAGSKTEKTGNVYVREVSDMSATDRKVLNLLLHINRAGEDQTLRAIVEGVTFINRNDHIKIPIRFTDWAIDPQVTFYPPIGGYPEAELTGKGDDFYVEFGTQGNFAINMRVRKAKNEAAYLPASQVKVEILGEVEDPEGIFTKLPAFDALTGEIIGTLSSQTGTAKLKVLITVTPANADNVTKYEYSRTLYITRK